jgi:hypothetical protein
VNLRGKSTACLLFVCFCVLPCLALQDEAAPDSQPQPGLSSLKKSLLIPGWGQLAEKRYVEGFLFLGAEVFSLYQIFYNNHKGNIYYGRYRDADNVEDAVRYRELTEDYDRKRNIFIFAAVGIWAVNLLDIYVIVKNKEKQKLKLQLQSVDHKGMAVTLHFSF